MGKRSKAFEEIAVQDAFIGTCKWEGRWQRFELNVSANIHDEGSVFVVDIAFWGKS